MPLDIPCSPRDYAYSSPPRFSTPLPVDYFSADHHNVVTLDKRFESHLRPDIVLPLLDCALDLKKGYDTYIKWQAPSQNNQTGAFKLLDEVCDFLLQSARRDGHADLGRATHNARFVSHRGTLARMAASPCNIGDHGWSIVTRQVGDTIFIGEYLTREAMASAEECSDAHGELMAYGGFKFEDYMTVKDRNTASSTKKTFNDPISAHDQFSRLFRSRLGGIELFYCAEMDCTAEAGQFQKGVGEADMTREIDIELKTQKEFEHIGKSNSFYKFKVQKWYLQSKLAGIERIVVGYRDDNQIVTKVADMVVDDIPTHAHSVCSKAAQARYQKYGQLPNKDSGAFLPAANFAFLRDVLSKIDKFYKGNFNDTYLKITWKQDMTRLSVHELVTDDEKEPYDFLDRKDMKSYFKFN